MAHGEEVLGMALPAGDEAPVIVKPGEGPFDPSAAPERPQRPSILSPVVTAGAVRGNQFDTEVQHDSGVERIAVVAAVRDQLDREVFEEADFERGGDEADFMRRSAGHVDGDRKTMAVADRHYLAALTTSSTANGGAPFLPS